MPVNPPSHLVAIIGAGPAGLYAAHELANQGVHVLLFNRDVKPGGLAEYGIYPNKYKMKSGLRHQFEEILRHPLIEYFGNLSVGKKGDLTLDQIREMGVQAILVTVGAQGTKWLGLPGEELKGVYHAKDLVYHYNQLPPYSQQPFPIGKRVVVVGVGNVMLDIAHWMIRELKVEQMIALARRGPAEVKFTKKEMETVAANLDLPALDAEIARCTPIMQAVGQNPAAARQYIVATLPKASPPVSDTRFGFRFLASPYRLIGNEQGQVTALEIEQTTLILKNGSVQAQGLGIYEQIPADTVVFAIGDRVDDSLGLSVHRGEFVKREDPCFPIDGNSYELFDPVKNAPIEDLFVAGWSRKASEGLVGVARKDGTNGAKAVLRYLEMIENAGTPNLERLDSYLNSLNGQVVRKSDLEKLTTAEIAEAQKRGLPEFKFSTNEEMLAVIHQ